MNITDYQFITGVQALKSLPDGLDFLNKIEADTELSETEKILFMDYLSGFNESLSVDIKTFCCDYFQDGKKFLSSNSYSNTKFQPFIRIKDIIRFSGWIKEIVDEDIDATIELLSNKSTPINIKEIAYKALVSTMIRLEIINDPKRSNYYLGVNSLSITDSPTLESAKTDPYMVWSFPLPENEGNLLELPKLSNLDCRAGLSDNKDLDKVVYSHDVSSCTNLKKPTVFDAEFYTQFSLGGKTKPLKECEDESGFDEYIHDPNKFKNILSIPKFISK